MGENLKHCRWALHPPGHNGIDVCKQPMIPAILSS